MDGVLPARGREIHAVGANVLGGYDFQVVALLFHTVDKTGVDEIRIAVGLVFVFGLGIAVGFVNQIEQVVFANAAARVYRSVVGSQLQVVAAGS